MADERRAFLDKAAQMYDELVAWNWYHRTGPLAELEQELRQRRRQLTGLILTHLLAERSRSAPPPRCPQCRRPMTSEGWRTRSVETLEGTARFTRPYYTCRRCGQSSYALDKSLGLTRAPWSAQVQAVALALAMMLPYVEASELFQALTGIALSRSALHRLSNSHTRDDSAVASQRRGRVRRCGARHGSTSTVAKG
ncbi:MAG: hypothetical protein HY329_00905 [Chloroflexi bacterium]|nr:hypothetical protein [Chloroflexota bacterium]